MSQPERSSRMAVLLFTDMVDSVALERRLGTEAYSRLLKQHHRLFLNVLTVVPGGEVRNDTGDGILCEFQTSAGAVNAALLFQLELRKADWELEKPKVRIGIHQGQLAEFQVTTAAAGKLVGMPINIASRVMSLAQAGQILMTRPVHDDARQFVREHPVLKPGDRPPVLKWKSHGQYLLKGNDDAVEVFEVGAAGVAPLTAPPSTEKVRSTREAPLAVGPASAPTAALMAVRKRSPLIGAVLTVACGLVLWGTTLGEGWVNASYDNLFRFGARDVTNRLVIVLMDNDAFIELNQSREEPRSGRKQHAKLLNKLADDGCPLAALDVRLLRRRDPGADSQLISAMSRMKNLVLPGGWVKSTHPGAEAGRPVPPLDEFLHACQTNWGVAWFDPDLDLIVRRDWPFPNPEWFPTLPWTMARLAGKNLNTEPQKRWLRYYDFNKTWTSLSYHLALTKEAGYYRDKIVFIGTKPATTLPDREEDEFSPPHIRWTGETVGGIELLATSFLNLMNDDSLRRPAWLLEIMILVTTGILLGGTLCRLRRSVSLGVALATAFSFMLAGILLGLHTNFWFPWLIIVGGQVPCALGWALVAAKVPAAPQPSPVQPAPDKTLRVSHPDDQLPDVPEYEVITPHIGEGGFGKVWLVRSAVGQWQALKAVYQSKFGENREPYEAEFKGLQNYKPVSEKHPGLLRIELVSKMKDAGYFYYVMELGDAQAPGWEKQPSLYKPKDLEFLRKQAYKRRLPPTECLRIVTVLADALNFLHGQGLTHRDIKPSNVIFVNGRPKLADVGLVAAIRTPGQVHTFVGTLGYVPPPPEPPGTAQADIYSLGMLLYVISTGRDPAAFPDLSTTLMERSGHAEFVRLNRVVLKACQPNLAERYQTTSEMLNDLQAAAKEMEC